MRRNIWIILALVISFLFLLASYIPNFYEASIAHLLPDMRVMTPAEHMYTYDYNVYLSKILQGKEGGWTVVDKYDNNPNQKGVFLQMLYLLAGKAGGLLNFSPGLTFHVLRTVLSAFWILTIVYLNIYFLGDRDTKHRVSAFIGILLSLFAASWPVVYDYLGQTWVGMHMSWWQELDVLKRISYIPHYTANYIIIAILTILLSKLEFRNSKYPHTSPHLPSLNKEGRNGWSDILNIKNLILEFISNLGFRSSDFKIICILLFVSFFIHPASGLLFIISWCIYFLIRFIQRPTSNFQFLPKIFFQTVILFSVAAIPLLYFQYITSSYPWKSLLDFDKLYRYPVNIKEYVLALGPVFFTGAMGGILALLKKEQKFLPLVTWILGAFLAIFAFKKFPFQSELRFVQTANHIPLAILTVYFFTNMVKTHRNASLRHLIKSVIVTIVIFVITLGLIQSYFSIRSQTDFIHQRVIAGQPLVPYPPQHMYPLKDMYNAFVWLDKNTENEEVVLSHVFAGNYIPAYSGNFVYLGQNPETPHYDERVKKLEAFYSGNLTADQAKKFLKEENISYVLYGPQEKEKSVEDIRKYKFLQPVFNSNLITSLRVLD
ncbi:hypothetical protein A2774_03630 [Candidatus Roizmanbacteria bacterium RIFCSPHIGHO2_01_FULL_39_12c]|uniref:Glycosyltransferase RgtA/B/C/D-like domain-containing protein n=1 Tax=Candidatus Roizmanbacteria bacterium RIFCSPHIGHO2_01_FULL_39_12c TaxID=1802031 RepID=A0A1F7GFK0_9BACT|nr:MAG: hypothetical protein A2774_03630 [Candidatus Roizmanbacteria bacterium RIFCSPHIGHO2_01_FULL_39_12c]OGK48154.1 MAG: hypothetical protein A2963_04375 [Candidatus Roizmanbacteria bacterium RIFCSPLOWO2_01_FULL_40_13]